MNSGNKEEKSDRYSIDLGLPITIIIFICLNIQRRPWQKSAGKTNYS
ncbi:Uncharacterised protein [uncultured archaeon]|nr:Uncharacterised protein [uncultured archaeon]